MDVIRELARVARPFTHADEDDAWIEALAGPRDARRFVLLGGMTHGTREFHEDRARITLRLVREHGFHGVAGEADGPAGVRLDRYLRGAGADRDADEALGGFDRFPRWPWRNPEVRDFVRGLRAHDAVNDQPAGFWGLDLYGMHASMRAVLAWLELEHPSLAERARRAYAVLEPHAEAPRRYGLREDASIGPAAGAQAAYTVLGLVRGVATDAEGAFTALRHASAVVAAEACYRGMRHAGTSTWNLREHFLADALDALAAWLERRSGRPARLVLWAHNAHVGDARAISRWAADGSAASTTLGTLLQERYGRDAVRTVGSSTHAGTVTAARAWGGPALCKDLAPDAPDSWAARLHALGAGRVRIDTDALRDPLPIALERSIGVLYLSHAEHDCHSFPAHLERRYDHVLHHDWTHATEPLDGQPGRMAEDAPETYPFGL
jgi:erythromycin esterase-like protein